jgi:hypothetical protein
MTPQRNPIVPPNARVIHTSGHVHARPRLFTIASLVMLVVAGLHTLGNLDTTPIDAREAAVQSAMSGYAIPLGMGMAPSILGIFRLLVFTMTVTLVALAALALVLAADRQVPARALRRVAVTPAIASGVLTAICFIYRVPPPLISFVVVTVLYAGATVTTKEAAPQSVGSWGPA